MSDLLNTLESLNERIYDDWQESVKFASRLQRIKDEESREASRAELDYGALLFGIHKDLVKHINLLKYGRPERCEHCCGTGKVRRV